jgi:rhodanese-related sulfurtransferase
MYCVMSGAPAGISPERAWSLLSEQRATAIDARPSTEYEASGLRIPGAWPVGAGSGVDILEALKAAPDDKAIIVYCGDPDQSSSALIARRVEELGLGEAFFLQGGFRAWRERNLPLEQIPDLAVAPAPQPGG